MTTAHQKAKFLDRLEEHKETGISEDSISYNLDDFIEYLIRQNFAKWISCKDHDNLILTEKYNRSKVQM